MLLSAPVTATSRAHHSFVYGHAFPLTLALLTQSDARLCKHADYQRVYKQSRKHFSPSMTYFFVERTTARNTGPRVGLTAGRVLGKAHERNRIKRRMRAAVRMSLALLTRDVDLVLHPRRTVLTASFAALESEVSRIFGTVEKILSKPRPAITPPITPPITPHG